MKWKWRKQLNTLNQKTDETQSGRNTNPNFNHPNNTKHMKALTESAELSSFSNTNSFDHIQRVAKVFSTSELVPKKYQGNPSNCIIALEMAGRMNVSPLMVMQNLDVILGKPCWSSKFLIASLNACGRFSPLRYEDDDAEGGRTRAYALDNKTGDTLYGVWVSMAMAKAEGWIDKPGSKWKTMPELMRRYRSASFFTNQYAPEISMGFQTVDEIYDITEVKSQVVNREDKEMDRIKLMVEDCNNQDELDMLYDTLPADIQDKALQYFETKSSNLKGKLL